MPLEESGEAINDWKNVRKSNYSFKNFLHKSIKENHEILLKNSTSFCQILSLETQIYGFYFFQIKKCCRFN